MVHKLGNSTNIYCLNVMPAVQYRQNSEDRVSWTVNTKTRECVVPVWIKEIIFSWTFLWHRLALLLNLQWRIWWIVRLS